MSEQPTIETAPAGIGTGTGTGTPPAGAEPERRPTPDLLTLVTGLVCLVVALMAITGWSPDISFDPRWILAGGAVALGTVLLVSSIRSRP
jgi:hypothetical protein